MPRIAGRDVIPKGFSVTVVEPQYPVNLGHIARLVKNFGVGRLCLVHPKVDMSVALIYAAHAADILENAETVTLSQLRKENELLVATTAVGAKRRSNVIRRSVKPEEAARHVQSARTASLVLGRDTTGLTNEEIRLCDMTTVVETGSRYKTLNVSHAAAILLYVITRGEVDTFRSSSRVAREVFAENLYDLAVASRMPAHRLRNMQEIGKRMAVTSRLRDEQLMLMSSVFKKAVGRIRDLQKAPVSKT
jgi:tRNA/rRNA methyltransferase